MGLFDGLIAKVEGAVTSAEVVAAGLYDTAKKDVSSGLTIAENAVGFGPFSTPTNPIPTTPFVGPLQPGVARPAPRPLTPSQVNAPGSSIASAFNMVTGEIEGDVTGTISKITDLLGLSTPKPAQSQADYSADTATWAKDLDRWKNILASLDRSMNARDGASDLSSKVRAWNSGDYQTAQAALALLVTGDKNADYNVTKSAYQQATSSASDLQKSIQDRWSQFASAGAPTVVDFVKAPITAVADRSSQAAAAIERATGNAVKSVAAPLSSFITYAPWIAGGLAALYVFSILPKRRGA